MKRLVAFKSSVRPSSAVLIDGHWTVDLEVVKRFQKAGIRVEVLGEWTIGANGKRMLKEFKM
ncbi:hypothetical protein TROPICALSUN_2 [Erwinia phage vB_EamM_TropicalSun]|uniref:Uncharacterized protein n=4 Tax=Myosmarvirus TaxID=2843428 RepID=A0A9E8JZX8_9CAUD|nr:hypothetical protein HWC56_gp091 [Serratia phage MyoSmar]QEG09540.1 hypothetical protein CPT_MyoSmar_091 [Serratia phage MyoSmar]QEG13793.1 hypothetical protein TROPICALSUN_2 [Erwinia phage vB_EamM_TropicalSun]UZS00404.1 hypothetical protein [Serratia phage SMP]